MSDPKSMVVRQHLRSRLEEHRVPEHLHLGLVEYITERRETGSFLKAVLENNLSEAVGRMAPFDGEGLRGLISFLHNHAPAPCWGSPADVKDWLDDPEEPVVGCD